VPIEREHLARQRAAVVDRHFQSPVDEAQHFATFGFGRRLGTDRININALFRSEKRDERLTMTGKKVQVARDEGSEQSTLFRFLAT